MSGGVLLQIASKFDPKGITEAKSGLDRLQSAGKAFGAIAAVAFAAAAAGAVAFGVESIKAAAHSEAVGRVLERMMTNSGAFGTASEGIKKASDEIRVYTQNLSNLTGIDDEILNSIAAGWMAVPAYASRGVKGIENMVKLVADIAAGTGKDVSAIGLAFTKVAGDAETAMSKLQRAGIVFTQDQKDRYQAILDANGEIAAQDFLMQQLGETYKGAAEAAANPFDVLSQIIKNLQEQIGTAFLPALEDALPTIRKTVDAFVASPEFATFIKDATDGFSNMMNYLPQILSFLTDLAQNVMPILNDLLPTFNNLIAAGSGNMKDMATNTQNAFKPLQDMVFLIKTVTDWGAAFNKWLQDVEKYLGDWGPVVKGIFDAINSALFPLTKTLGLIADLIKYLTGQPIDLTQFGYVEPGGLTSAPGGAPISSFNGYGGAGGLRPMATGGIVMGPTSALVGEAGPEAIIPLDRLGKMGGNSYNINVTAGVGDPAAIGQQIVTYIKKFERSGGPVFVGA